MTPQELRTNIERMQACSLMLIINLAKHNKDLADIATAIDNKDASSFMTSMAGLGRSSRGVADSLSEYCSSSEFFLRGDWLNEIQPY